jgi:hypothetical protein
MKGNTMRTALVVMSVLLLIGCAQPRTIERSHDEFDGSESVELKNNVVKSGYVTELNARVVRDRRGEQRYYLVLKHQSRYYWFFVDRLRLLIDGGDTLTLSGEVTRWVTGMGIAEQMYIPVDVELLRRISRAESVSIRVHGDGKYYPADLSVANIEAFGKFLSEAMTL